MCKGYTDMWYRLYAYGYTHMVLVEQVAWYHHDPTSPS